MNTVLNLLPRPFSFAERISRGGKMPAARLTACGRGGEGIRPRPFSTVAVLALAVALAAPAHAGLAELETTEIPAATAKQSRVLKLITYLIDKSHYRKRALDDEFSAAVLRAYLDRLDPGKMFFLRADIEQFDALRHRFDDFIRAGDIRPAFTIFSIFRTRLEQRVDYVLARLHGPLDFGRDEAYLFDREEARWAADAAALDDLWRRRIKNDIIGLRLAGKDEAEVFATLEKRYTHLARRTRQFKSDDVFQTFANAYLGVIDPHTSYFSPRASENFHIQMRLSLEGIGAVLQSEDEYTLVRRIIPGGPADLGGELQAGDRIVGVAANGPADRDITDVIGWRLDDVVDMIRGPKDSLVSLEVLPAGNAPDAPGRVITIRRDKINLEEQAAKKRILRVGGGGDIGGADGDSGGIPDSGIPGGDPGASPAATIGVIDLPSFYIDFNGMQKNLPDYRSTTRDVRKILAEFRDENIDGLLIDLRGNGGGALTEAVSLTGLFIREGPVVQVQSVGGRVNADHDPDPDLVYDGPLAVLVDRHSASASEIFAGAIQDYRRGLIIGEPTYGKGTVQHLVNLNRWAKSEDDLGQLKVTVAQFFRVNGGSTQYRGIVPDLIWPSAAGGAESGERGYENALPWRQIEAAEFDRFRDEPPPAVFEMLRGLHEARVQDSPEFQYFIDLAAFDAELGEKTAVTLNQRAREAERDARETRQLALENRMRRALGQSPKTALDSDAADSAADGAAADAATVGDTVDADEPDAYLREGGDILRDYLTLLKSAGGAVATQSETDSDGLLSN
ncbi:MAG: carboxy terminal-processing peptidase [Gammaproteobacteria bacterium]|nr:carboxy terminal-processing peptidase [Gammaproteobacteria bacterium]